MPQPIDVNAVPLPTALVVDAAVDLEVFIETQADDDVRVFQQIAARRAQLEDAETLRRMRAL